MIKRTISLLIFTFTFLSTVYGIKASFAKKINFKFILKEDDPIFTQDPSTEFASISFQTLYGDISVVSDIYKNANEIILFSFKTKSGKTICLAKELNDQYFVYKFGTNKKIELVFPESKNNSWNKFTYSYYLRGGGAENEGLDDNKLSFTIDSIQYTLYDSYYAPTEKTDVGILIKNTKTDSETDIKAIPETVKGSLIDLRDLPFNEGPPDEETDTDLTSGTSFKILKDENIGGLRFGMKPSEIVKLFGKADSIRDEGFNPHIGYRFVYWKYPNMGLSLILINDSESNNSLKLAQITITENSLLKTKRSVGIGSTLENVLNTYSDFIKPASAVLERDNNMKIIEIGEPDGIQFKFLKDKITRISLGTLQFN